MIRGNSNNPMAPIMWNSLIMPCLAVMALASIVTSFGQISPTPSGHLRVEVVNGDGSENDLAYGDSVEISATVPENSEFIKWFLIEGDGTLEDPFEAETEFTVGQGNAKIVAVFAKFVSWFPPGPVEDNTTSILLPKPQSDEPVRLEQKLRITLDRGSCEEPEYEDIWSAIKARIEWEDPQHVKYFTEKEEGDEIENQANIPRDSFESSSGSKDTYEASIWFEGNLTQEEIAKLVQSDDALGVEVDFNLVVDGTDKDSNWTGMIQPVSAYEIWSNQIADVEVNGFPNKTGRGNQPYALMGVRNDGKAYVRLKLTNPIPESLRSKILFRLYQPNVVKSGISTFDDLGKFVSITAENVSDNPLINHRIYFGIDDDEDGILSIPEIKSFVLSTANGVDTIPVEFRVVSKNRHEQSRLKNIEFAASGFLGFVPSMAPNGAALIDRFHKSAAPPANIITHTTIDRTGQNRMAHPVGVAFTPRDKPGVSVNGVYKANHDLALNVLKSSAFRSALRDGFDNILPILANRWQSGGSPSGDSSFSWAECFPGNNEQTPSLNFSPNIDFLRINEADYDSFLALGKVRVENGRILFRYDLQAQYVEVYFRGKITDLYDFDYDDSFNLVNQARLWNDDDEIRQGAETQAGYPSLPKGGRVFTTEINFIPEEEDLYFDTGYRFFIYK